HQGEKSLWIQNESFVAPYFFVRVISQNLEGMTSFIGEHSSTSRPPGSTAAARDAFSISSPAKSRSSALFVYGGSANTSRYWLSCFFRNRKASFRTTLPV